MLNNKIRTLNRREIDVIAGGKQRNQNQEHMFNNHNPSVSQFSHPNFNNNPQPLFKPEPKPEFHSQFSANGGYGENTGRHQIYGTASINQPGVGSLGITGAHINDNGHTVHGAGVQASYHIHLNDHTTVTVEGSADTKGGKSGMVGIKFH